MERRRATPRSLAALTAAALMATMASPGQAASPVAVNPTGNAVADYVAVSGTGGAAAGATCDYETPFPVFLPCFGVLALSGTGASEAGLVAVSGSGPSRGFVAVSLTGDSQGFLAVSGTGTASGTVPLCGARAADCLGLAAVVVSVPTGASVGPDADGDKVPASVTLQFTTLTVDPRQGTVMPGPGSSATVRLDPNDDDPANPVDGRASASVPTGLAAGPDQDRDGVPSNASVQFTQVAVDAHAGTVTTSPGPSRTVRLDPDDADPDSPLLSVLRARLPTGAVPGPDADRDGVPADVTLSFAELVLDRRDASLSLQPGGSEVVRLDPNDADPDSPAASVVRARVPTGASPGPDGDQDGVPSSVAVAFTELTVDRRDGSLALTPSGEQPVRLDPNDADANNPIVSVVRAAVPTAVVPGADADRDGVPANASVAFTELTLDRRTGSLGMRPASQLVVRLDPNDRDANIPVVSVVRATVPTGASPGPDADQDGLPATLTLSFTAVTLDRRDPSLSLAEAPAQSVVVDPNDADPHQPVNKRVTASVPTSAELQDADGDGVPDTLALSFTDVTVDGHAMSVTTQPGRTLSARVVPPLPRPPLPRTVSATAPTGASLGPDADQDGVPASLEVQFTTVTLDTANGTLSLAPAAPRTLRVDPDDANANNPVPRPPTRIGASLPTGASLGPDADGDKVPASVTVEFTEVFVDAAQGSITSLPGQPRTLRLDPNDNDAGNPAPQAPKRLSASVPGGIALGPDNDHDGQPATLLVQFTTVTVDTQNGTVTMTPGTSQAVRVDPNDNQPAPAGASPGDANGGLLAVSLFGNATACSGAFACAALSLLGGAQACRGLLTCAALSVLGDSDGYNAVSIGGNASGCQDLDFQCTAVSVLGDARADDVAASLAGDSEADDLALSGTGDARAAVPLSVLGTCNGQACYAADPLGNASGHWLAASGLGGAQGLVALSGAGAAQGGLVGASGTGPSQGGLVGASATGDSQGGLLSLSLLGRAQGPIALGGCDLHAAACSG